jgi:hypothetical protein
VKIFVLSLSIVLIASVALAADGLKGKISAIDVKKNIVEVSGVTIDASRATIKSLADTKCSLSELKLGDTVDVDGAFSGKAKMVATEIEVDEPGKDEIKGKLEKVDTKSRTLKISGITIVVIAGAMITDKDDQPINMENLKTGYPVECTGDWIAPRKLTAQAVELD